MVDWFFLICGIVYVLALHAETKLKAADILMNLDAHLAPNWYFAGLYKDGLQFVSLFGGLGGAGLLAYDWFYLVGLWSTVIFFGLLYLKYAVATRRGMRLAISAIPAGWKSPFATGDIAEIRGILNRTLFEEGSMTDIVKPMPDRAAPPFVVGDIVTISGSKNMGLQRVDVCELRIPPGWVEACWMCQCSDAGTWVDPVTVRKREVFGEAGGTWTGPCSYLVRNAGNA